MPRGSLFSSYSDEVLTYGDRSRTFLRMSGGDVRFLAVDEPTSALDPEGEFQLFRRLREERMGKTIVFITHRFGHLTKYADIILYATSLNRGIPAYDR